MGGEFKSNHCNIYPEKLRLSEKILINMKQGFCI